MASAITVEGADRAAAQLRAVGQRALDQSDTFEVQGRRAQRSITRIPVRTGRLERGVTGGPESILRAGPAGYTIATAVPYARFVFGGTSRMPARPPHVPNTLGPDAAQAVGRDVVR